MNKTTQRAPKVYRFSELRGRKVFDNSGERSLGPLKLKSEGGSKLVLTLLISKPSSTVCLGSDTTLKSAVGAVSYSAFQLVSCDRSTSCPE
jgi:hypothetical protein